MKPDLPQETAFLRQRKLYDQKLDHKAIVIGAGSLGSYILHALSKLGLAEIDIFDYDKVEEHNIANQAFGHNYLGTDKAYAAAYNISNYASRDMVVNALYERWTPDYDLNANLIVNAPDCIDTRKLVMQNLPKQAFVVDVRSGGEQFNIFCADTSSNREMEFYSEQFFDKSEATGTDCSAQATGFNSMLIASLAVDLYVRWANRQPYPNLIEGCARNFVFSPLWVGHKPEE